MRLPATAARALSDATAEDAGSERLDTIYTMIASSAFNGNYKQKIVFNSELSAEDAMVLEDDGYTVERGIHQTDSTDFAYFLSWGDDTDTPAPRHAAE